MKNRNKLIIWGMLFALTTEILDNFVVNSRSPLLILAIVPIYALLFFVFFGLFKKFKLSPRKFSLAMGIIGLVIIENIILKKHTEPWPIQLFMFSYWFSIFSYPLLLLNKSKKILILPITIGLIISTIVFGISKNTAFIIPFFIVTFYIISAFNIFFKLKPPEKPKV